MNYVSVIKCVKYVAIIEWQFYENVDIVSYKSYLHSVREKCVLGHGEDVEFT